jgi:type IV secretion system protein VirB10
MPRARSKRQCLVSEGVALDESLPLVGEDRGNRGLWLGLGAIVASGALLFTALESARQSSDGPQIAPPRDYAIATVPRAELAIPESYGPMGIRAFVPAWVTESAVTPRLPPAQLNPMRPSMNYSPGSPEPVQRSYLPEPVAAPTAPGPGRSAPSIVFDAGVALGASGAGTETTSPALRATTAVAAAPIDRRNIVSQGTLIYAVLETALDSTQSGQVRAMISTDVYNASGTKVLIPKGSRVHGEYKSDLSSGQNRAAVIWGRLIRPDGVSISLDSPASDQLGRAGVTGRVDTHFGERLLNALLQSTIDIGAAAASRAVTSSDGVTIALPTATQNAGSQIIQPPPKPTLKVRHGTRIAVFVARDLDFSAVN